MHATEHALHQLHQRLHPAFSISIAEVLLRVTNSDVDEGCLVLARANKVVRTNDKSNGNMLIAVVRNGVVGTFCLRKSQQKALTGNYYDLTGV